LPSSYASPTLSRLLLLQLNFSTSRFLLAPHPFCRLSQTLTQISLSPLPPDLGWRGLCHWSHSHGAPRVFNPASANLYNSLFAGEAGQRTVANEDSVPTIIPESDDYTFTLEGFHIYGTNSTYGMSVSSERRSRHESAELICRTFLQQYAICKSDPTDPECLGGDVATDSLFYYTPVCRLFGSTLFNRSPFAFSRRSDSAVRPTSRTGLRRLLFSVPSLLSEYSASRLL
jgi:hypothetical protein